MPKPRRVELDPASKNFTDAFTFLSRHPMFAPLLAHAHVVRNDTNSHFPENGWASVGQDGYIYVHPKRRGEVAEWVYVLAHCLLHLGFGHFKKKDNPVCWNIACDSYVAKFLLDMKLGKAPAELGQRIDYPIKDEDSLYQRFCEIGVPGELQLFGVGGEKQSDMLMSVNQKAAFRQKIDWETLFGRGLSAAVTKAVEAAGGFKDFMSSHEHMTPVKRARSWFMSHYPLLGSLASGFDIIEDPLICQRLDISIAAIDVTTREIFFNPAAGLSEAECRFVMAHELLHAGLCHHERCQGRDPYFWNVACDYVINAWLFEMGIGEIPQVGILMDLDLKGLSAETIYDRIVTDMRTYRKLYTLRGYGQGDIIDKGHPAFWDPKNVVNVDDFCKNALLQGLVYHEEQGRGYLPAGLVEEIKSLGQPPIPWDVELAKWFDQYFDPIEKTRTYARMSRRQSSTPDIPRPKWVRQAGAEDGRTFAVVLDTSGSMDRNLLGKALGTIASYAVARDVPYVRVVFCDAVPYDEGYVAPEDIAERMKVKGRGGTILQPGIDLVQSAEDFPKNGPILVITDGNCDRLTIRRDHAFVIPKGAHLPFVPRGPIFRVE